MLNRVISGHEWALGSAIMASRGEPDGQRREIGRPGDESTSEFFGGTVAELLVVRLLLAAGGDSELALQYWRELRSDLDLEIEEFLARDVPVHGRALMDAVSASLASETGDAAVLARRAIVGSSDAVGRADAQAALAKLGTWSGESLRTAALAELAAQEVGPHDPIRAGGLLIDAATTLANAGHLALAEPVAHRAMADVAGSPELELAADVLVRYVRSLTGAPVAVPRNIQNKRGFAKVGDVRIGVLASRMLVWDGEYNRARELIAMTELTARSDAPDALPFVLDVSADLDIRVGSWDNAANTIAEGERLTVGPNRRNVRALFLARGARMAALRGDLDGCLKRLDEADLIERAGGLLNVRMHLTVTKALLAMGAGDHERALAYGVMAKRIAGDMQLDHSGVDPFWGDLIESMIRLGMVGEAERAIAELEVDGRRRSHQLSLEIAARGRLLLAPDDLIEDCGREVVAYHERWVNPFEHARSYMALGERRRRVGNRSWAREVLLQAHDEFARLDARPWVDLVLDELRASGASVFNVRGISENFEVLSPQEIQVARVVANGATNDEAAAALFLSRKSIERHLTSIYRKLNLRSRVELALWAEQNRISVLDGDEP